MAGEKSVFVSYSSKDIKLVKQIVEVLRQMGITYWKAPEMIPAGSSYAREIPRAIRECEIFLLVLSKQSQASIWVEKEIDNAINHRKVIVPIQIDEEPLCEMFRFYLNNIQTIFYKDDYQKDFEALKTRLRELLRIDELEDPEFVPATKIKQTRMSMKEQAVMRSRVERANVFVINKKPEECQYCGGSLEQVGVGIFSCQMCGKENYDYLRIVRNYLEKEGPRPAVVIARDTGIPRQTVEHFLREEFLEIPKYAMERLSCEKCGKPIRTGYLCDTCKGLETPNKIDNLKGKWHSKK